MSEKTGKRKKKSNLRDSGLQCTTLGPFLMGPSSIRVAIGGRRSSSSSAKVGFWTSRSVSVQFSLPEYLVLKVAFVFVTYEFCYGVNAAFLICIHWLETGRRNMTRIINWLLMLNQTPVLILK